MSAECIGGCGSQGGPSHTRALTTAAYCSALFLGGLCVNIIGPAGPTLARSMHTSVAMIGNIFAAEGAGNTLGSSLISALLDRFSGHTLIASICLLLFFVVGLVPSCTSIAHVVVLYMIVGGCLGLMCGASNTLVTWVHAGSNVGPWVNLINASFGLGASCAPLLFVAVEQRVGNGLAAFSAIGVFAMVPALSTMLLPSPARPPPKQLPQGTERDEEEEEESARHPLRGLGIGRGASTFAGIDLGSRATYVRVTVVAPLMAVVTLVIGAEIAFAGWIYTYAIERAGMKREAAAYLNSLFWTTFTVGRVCTIPLAACLSPGMLLVPTLVLEVASVVGILAAPGSESVLWLCTVGAGVGCCALYSNVLSLLATYELLTASTVSLIGMASALGHMTIPNLVGFTMHTGVLGNDALVWIVAVANVLGLSLVSAVVVHLWRHFTPNPESVQGRWMRKQRQQQQQQYEQKLEQEQELIAL